MTRIDALIRSLGDEQACGSAIAQLAALGAPAVRRLVAIVDGTAAFDRPPRVDLRDFAERLDAALSAAARNAPEAFFQEALRDGRRDCRSIVSAASALKDPRAAELLFSAARASNGSARWTAIRALAKRRSARAREALIRALKDRDSLVRLQAVEGLRRVGDCRALEPLQGVLTAQSNARWPGLLAAASRAIERIEARQARARR